MSDAKIKILLVDDQVLFVESLKNVLEMRTGDIVVVGIASNGREALALAEEKIPEIVLMDVRMPEMDGVEACGKLVRKHPDIKIMMLTTFDDDEYVFEALRVGAVGYVLKNIPPEELIDSIRAIHSGISQMSPSVMRKLAAGRTPSTEESRRVSPEAIGRAPEWLEDLSKREKDILKLLVDGYSNKEVAEALCIAEQTVKNHLSIVYSKLQTRDRSQTIRKVRDYL